MAKKNILSLFSLFFFFLLCFAIALMGHWATEHSVHSWYLALNKPSWNPPSWVFAPAWSVLYCLIAIAGWLIFLQKPSKHKTIALRFYFTQLALNSLWSFSFFYFQSPALGLINIILLEIAIGWTLFATWPINKKAAYLLAPYFLWVFYAATLNAALYWMNR